MKSKIIVFALLTFLLSYNPAPVYSEDQSSKVSPEMEAALHAQARVLFDRIKSQGPRFNLIGEVQPGVKSKYSINGEDFDISQKTRVYGSLNIGSYATVSGDIINGLKQARIVQVGADSSTEIPNGRPDH